MINKRVPIVLILALLALGASPFVQIARAQTGKKKPAAAKKPVSTATPKNPHAALAVDKADGFYYGFSFDHPTLQAAEQRALDECTKRGGKCSVVLSWSGTGCGAYRTVASKVGYAYGWGIAPTKEAADAIATAEATKRSNRQPVPNFAFACNSASPSTLDVLRNDDRHTHQLTALAFSPDGRTLGSGSFDQSAKLWDLTRGTMLRSFTAANGVNAVFFLDGGKQFGFLAGHQIRIHDSATGAELRHVPARPRESIYTIGISADERSFVTEGYQSISRWDAATLARTSTINTASLRPVVYSSDGRLVVYGVSGGAMEIANTTTGAKIHSFVGHPGQGLDNVQALAITPNNQYIASSGRDKAIKIWSPASKTPVKTMAGHSDRIQSMVFSPDGNILASAGNDKVVKLWHWSSGTLFATLTGHTASVVALAFSPDGKLLASGGDAGDQTIRIWDVATKKEVRVLSKFD